eukprot:GFUD01041684.1.p1 GENE.GFUD01041684.1~~GFUD01041684.1.p1  ORF type:complete len:492 (-),score=102.99 GFUD01041684.1:10-1485(-)
MKDLSNNFTLTSVNHTKQINEAFDQFASDDPVEQNIKVFTEDGTIYISQKILLFSSSYLRSLVSSLPMPATPVFIIPESSRENIEYIVDLLASGEVTFKDKTEDDLTKLKDDAKTLGIDLSNVKLPKKVKKAKPGKQKTPNKQDLMIDSFLLQSISNLLNQCTVCFKQFDNQTKLVLCYCNHFYQELREKFAFLLKDLSCNLCKKKFVTQKALLIHLGNVHRMINVILKEKGITQIAKENDELESGVVVEEQGVLYKTEEPAEFLPKIISSISLREEALDNNILIESDNIAIDIDGNICEVCSEMFTTTDSLWLHHCEEHFLVQLQNNLNNSAKTRKGQCNICDLKLKSRMELAVHMGTNHQKLNELLMAKGYMPLDAFGIHTNDEDVAFADKEEITIKKDIDIVHTCEICGVGVKHLYSLWRHICSTHYMKKLKQDYSHLVKDWLQCDICGVKADHPDNLMKHIGIYHFKLNDILANQGRRSLEIPSFTK